MRCSGSSSADTMVKVFFSPEARQDLQEAGDYIACTLRNKSAARSLIQRVQGAVRSLEQFPASGTPLFYAGQDITYRYVVCGNYLLFYHFAEGNVYIDRILYGRRDYLSILFGDELKDENNE